MNCLNEENVHLVEVWGLSCVTQSLTDTCYLCFQIHHSVTNTWIICLPIEQTDLALHLFSVQAQKHWCIMTGKIWSPH